MEKVPESITQKQNNSTADRKKIGLFINSVSNSVRAQEWQGIISACRKKDIDLFCFSGNLIEDTEEITRPDSFVSNIISQNTLDGIIIWFGGFGPFDNKSDIINFINHFKSIPIVTGELELPGIPAVIDDSYEGIKKAVNHLVRHHNKKKILFLRGPKFHWGSNQRYKGFLDAMTENNIPINQQLITPPAIWNTGRELIQMILDEKNLAPGKDFEAIICSSGGLAFNAMDSLHERGIRIPQDIVIIGYNDLDRERSAHPPLTSINPHFFKMGETAVELLTTLIDGDSNIRKVIVPGTLVVRTSCGCMYDAPEHISSSEIIPTDKTKDSLIQKIMVNLRNNTNFGISEKEYKDISVFLKYFHDFISKEETDLHILFSHLEKLLCQNQFLPLFHIHWQSIITNIQGHFLSFFPSQKKSGINSCIREIQSYIYRMSILTFMREIDKSKILMQRLREIDTSFFSYLATDDFSAAFTKKLNKLNIKNCFISLFENSDEPELYAKLYYGLNNCSVIDTETVNRRYPAGKITPDEYIPKAQQFSTITQGIYSGKNLIGFACIEIIHTNGYLYEALGDELNSAINKIQSIKKQAEEIDLTENINHDFREYLSLFIKSLYKPLERMVLAGKTFFGKSSQSPEMLKDDIIRIYASINKAEYLLKDLIDYTNVLVSGGNNQKVNLNDTIDTIIGIFQNIIDKQLVSIEKGELPVIEADPIQMQLLFFHLIDNAIKFNRPGNKIKINISVSGQGNIFTDIMISDNGIGIPKDLFLRIFDIFDQGDSSHSQDGTGIGLALCKMIVENHNGIITVSSVENEGSQFYIRLPLSQKKTEHALLILNK